MTELFCRFCAQSELASEIIDFSSDTELRNEIVENLAIIGIHDVDLTDKSLPEAVCTYCREILSMCCKFLLNVRKSQTILRGLNENINRNNLFIEHSTPYQVKDEPICTESEDNEGYYDGSDYNFQGGNNIDMKTEDSIQIEQNGIEDENFQENPLKLEESEVNVYTENTAQLLQRQSCRSYREMENIAISKSLKDITRDTTRCTGRNPLLTNLLTTTKDLINNTSLISKCLNSSTTLKLTPPSELLPLKTQETVQTKEQKSIVQATDGKSDHVRKRTQKRFTCKICHAVFDKRNHLNKHKLIHTEGQRDFKCDECGKAFVRMSDLTGHIGDTHKIEPRACPVCSKVFKNENRLKKHVLIHSGIKYECDYCHRTYKTRGQIFEHIKTIHSDRPSYLCNFCGKGCRTRSELKNHENVHKKKTPHTCPECGRKFTMWGNCDSHMKRMHGLTLAKTVKTPLGRIPIDQTMSASVAPKDETIQQFDTGKKDFSCEACGKIFDSQKVLKEHQKIAHNKKDTQVCQICKKEYAHMVGLKMHMKTHEGKIFECDRCHRRYKSKKTLERHMAVHDPNPWTLQLSGSKMSLYLEK